MAHQSPFDRSNFQFIGLARLQWCSVNIKISGEIDVRKNKNKT